MIFFNKLETWLSWLLVTNASVLVWIISNSDKYKFSVEQIGITQFAILKFYFFVSLIEMVLGFIFLGIYKSANLPCEVILNDLKVSIYEIKNYLSTNVISNELIRSFKEFKNKSNNLRIGLKIKSGCRFLVFLGFYFFALGFSTFILLLSYKLYVDF